MEHISKTLEKSHRALSPRNIPNPKIYEEELSEEKKWLLRGVSDINHTFDDMVLSEKFKNVYNEKPKDSTYINEWDFFSNTRDSDKEIPESVPSVEVYKKQSVP